MILGPNGKTFRPMLALSETPADLNDYERHCPLYGSYKLDGIRALGYSGTMVSRSLKPTPSKYAQEIAKVTGHLYDGELVIKPKPLPEGETIYHATFSAVMTDDCMEPLDWWLFDYAYAEQHMPYSERRDILIQSVGAYPHPDIKILEQRLLQTPAEIAAMEQESLDLGYEGLIVRRPDAPYHCNRSSWNQGYLMKVVRVLTSEAEITGFTEMMHNDNEAKLDARGYTKRSQHQENKRGAGMLGAFYCKDIHGLWDGAEFKCGIGEGMDHAFREEVFKNQDRYMKRIFTYSYKLYGSKNLPRQPKWKVWRDPRDMS